MYCRFPQRKEARYGLARSYQRRGEVVLEREAWGNFHKTHGVSLWETGEWDLEQVTSWEADLRTEDINSRGPTQGPDDATSLSFWEALADVDAM
jgi:hypothetical protein